MACAVFVIAAVGAHRPAATSDSRLPPGAGGYAVAAESDLPVHGDLNDTGVRRGLGLPPALEATLEGTRIVQLRSLPGEDVSCLNLYRPGRPRLLGAPPELVEAGRFPLRLPPAPGPAHGRQPLAAAGGGSRPRGRSRRGRRQFGPVDPAPGPGGGDRHRGRRGPDRAAALVALLQRSILQSELLISEAAFRAALPGADRVRLLPGGDPGRVPRAGADRRPGARPARLRLRRRPPPPTAWPASSRSETTYLSTFQSLGGLGLLLGTVGLGLLLLRNAFERRRELAALQAFGFRRRRLARLLFWETGLLLLGGIGLGALAAAVASLPHLGPRLPWASLGSTLGLVLGRRMAGQRRGRALALRRDLLPALKGE